jgi:hypothetical protein
LAWIVFGRPNPVAIAIVVAIALGVHVFVVFYEEPTLCRKFGRNTRNIAMSAAGGRVSAVEGSRIGDPDKWMY